MEAAYADLLDALAPRRRGRDDVTDIGWMVEELRVSLFAQSLGTAGPVSAKRVQRAIQGMRDRARLVGPVTNRLEKGLCRADPSALYRFETDADR